MNNFVPPFQSPEHVASHLRRDGWTGLGLLLMWFSGRL